MIGLDVGSKNSGVVVIDDNGIREGYNIENKFVFAFIRTEAESSEKVIVIIEDIKPYRMQITNGIIQTIKFLGEMEYRLNQAAIAFKLVARWEVKKWVYNKYTRIVDKEIKKNIIRFEALEKKKAEEANKDYEPKNRTPTFVYVDDRIVIKAMRLFWKIENVKGWGKKGKFNLKDHSWQALGVCTAFMAGDKTFFDIKHVLLKSTTS